MCCGVPSSFSTSTAARRAYSFSSLQHLDQVTSSCPGCLALHDDVDGRSAATSRSGSRSSCADGPMSTLPVHLRERVQRGLADHLVRILSCVWSAAATSGRLKRDRMLMMCMRAIGVLALDAAGQLGDRRSRRRSRAMMRNSGGFLVGLLVVGVLQQVADGEARSSAPR